VLTASVLAALVLAPTLVLAADSPTDPDDLAAAHAHCIGDSIFAEWELFKDLSVAPRNRDFWSELGDDEQTPSEFVREAFLIDTLNADEATVTIDGAYQQDEDGEYMTPIGLLSGLLYECLADELAMPERVQNHVEQTRALDGFQEDSWGIYEARWAYHPDDGLSLTIWIPEPDQLPLETVPPVTFDYPVIEPATTTTTPIQMTGDESSQMIRGRVQNEFIEDGEEVREGVPDVRIVVETADGEVVAEAVTDEEGNYEIPVEEPGTYNVRLDTETLPEGVTVPEGETDTYEDVQVRPNSSTTRAFFVGERQTGTTTGPTTTVPPTTTPTTDEFYTVVPGDTLFGVARKLGIEVPALLAANGLTEPR
jgi:LysM repeat protein